MIIIWQAVMIFKMSYRVFMLFTSIDPTQAPPFIPHLRGGSLLAGRDINNTCILPFFAFFITPLFFIFSLPLVYIIAPLCSVCQVFFEKLQNKKAGQIPCFLT
jgi:hypothetical protein